MDRKIELIRGAPLFSQCSRRELAAVAAIADEVDVPAGKELMREGERGLEFFVLVEGDVEVVKDGEAINALGPGDFFGEIALLAHSPRTATVRTTSPSRLLVVTAARFGSLLERAPEIQLKVLRALAERLAPHMGDR